MSGFLASPSCAGAAAAALRLTAAGWWGWWVSGLPWLPGWWGWWVSGLPVPNPIVKRANLSHQRTGAPRRLREPKAV